jgi:ABC-type antimicrobial peptide transport system permease subunit
MLKDVPGIAHVALAFSSEYFGAASQSLMVGEKRFTPTGIATGADFLKIFQYPLLEGTNDSTLLGQQSIVLTESMSKALFGNVDPMGKTVMYNHDIPLKVTGILKDIPANSNFRFDFLTLFAGDASQWWIKNAVHDWNLDDFKIFVSLNPHVSYSQVEPQISGLVKKYAPATYQINHQQPILQPLKDWHLFSEYKNGLPVDGLIEYVRIFTIVGILVLMIACINFINLSTARSEKRAMEVGLRKVVGSSRNWLIFQFLSESIMLATGSFLLALVMVHLTLPLFNTMAQTDIHVPYLNPVFWVLMLSYILFTGFLAGSRPAFYLSSFQPVKVLKGKLHLGASAALPRKILVVIQFSSSIAFIIGTIIIYQQIAYARNRDRGYDSSRLVVSEEVNYNYPAMKQEALESGAITSMTASLSPPTEIYAHGDVERWTGGIPTDAPIKVDLNAIGDSDYFKTLGIAFKEGRNFIGEPGRDDTVSAIFNEAAIKRMGISHPLNQTISWSYSTLPKTLRIVGVVNDAVTYAPFAAPEPMIYVHQGWLFTFIYRLSPNMDTHVALDKLQVIFNKYRPGVPFQYHFVDDNFAAKFAMENLVGKLAGIFAFLAIFISCLGLFGLAAYVAEQRTREIGIRKVLGASVKNVFFLITKDFITLMLVSCLIAVPVAFYFLWNWLHGYYYHISIQPWVFLISALGAMLIALATISFQAVKAALMNPVQSLRTE